MFVVTIGSAVAALTVAVVLLRAHAPEGGYVAWVRESFSPIAREERRHFPDFDSEELLVSDILAMSERGPAYQEAPDLRQVVRRSARTR